MTTVQYRVSWGENSTPDSEQSVSFSYLRSAQCVADELRQDFPNVKVWTRMVEASDWCEVDTDEAG